MKINYSNILLVAWSIIALLLYLSFFSSFGYLEIREKTLYKNNLIYENEYLEKENKLLEEKILKLEIEKNQIQKQNNNSIYIFKFDQAIPDEKIEKQKKERRIYNFYKEKKLYFYLYFFLVILGYIYIIFFIYKTKNNK
jgi:cell division protein FtsB